MAECSNAAAYELSMPSRMTASSPMEPSMGQASLGKANVQTLGLTQAGAATDPRGDSKSAQRIRLYRSRANGFCPEGTAEHHNGRAIA